MAFEVTPADMVVIYWSHTIDEIRNYLKLKLRWWHVQYLQEHQILSIIVKNAFGGSDSQNDGNSSFKSADEAKAKLAGLFNPR